MKGSSDAAFKQQLKQMIIDACGKQDVDAQDIPEDVDLFSDASALALDSLDGLQISMAIQREFGVRINDPKDMRRILSSINALADYLQPGSAE